MRKQLVMAAAIVLSAGVAGAQKISGTSTKGSFALKGCSFIQEGLQCDLTYTPAEDGSYYFSSYDFHVVTPDGVPVQGYWVKAAGGQWQSNNTGSIISYAGVNYQVSLLFKVPKTTRSLTVFSAYGGTLRNVAIGGATTAVPTPSSPSVNLPTTQAFIGGKAYTVSFTNCKLNSAGAYVCTSTVTPSR